MIPTTRLAPVIFSVRSHSRLTALLVSGALMTGCGGGGSGADGGSKVEPTTYFVSGTLSGLSTGQTLSLVANGGTPMQLANNGVFTFPQAFKANAPYAVTVGTQPLAQICAVANGSATITGNVTNVAVTCETPPPVNTVLSIGGSVSGMKADGALELHNEGAARISVRPNGTFAFSSPAGSTYAISVARQPAGQLCAVDNGDGIAATSLSTLGVTCRTAELSIITGSGGGSGRADGVGSNARFDRPQGIAVDSFGNVFVADWYNQTIRKITPAGVVTTFAGTYRSTGAADGTGSAAQFCHPLGIAIDQADNLYVTDTCNEIIRKITPAAVVTTLAGTAGQGGSADGTGPAARFGMLAGIAVDGVGNLYVADYGNQTIRKVSPAGVVTTLAGTPGVAGFQDGTGSGATFANPNGIAVDAQGTVYVADTSNQLVRRITPAGVVSTLAGTTRMRGNLDGQGAAAAFSFGSAQLEEFRQPALCGMVVDSSGTLFITDRHNNTVRTVSPTGLVTTAVGDFLGYREGEGRAARMHMPTGIAIDRTGSLYVADDYNYVIRKISASLATSLLAGKPQLAGGRDGVKGVASFNAPSAVASDAAGNLYIADQANSAVRKISPAGVTSTLAGTPGMRGTVDGMGPAARFHTPTGIAVGLDGSVYVADMTGHAIRKITPDGMVSTLAGSYAEQAGYVEGEGAQARFRYPTSLAVDAGGNVFVADSYNRAVRKITPDGRVTTLGGGAIRGLTAVAVDAAGTVYYSSSYGHIKKISPDGTVSLLAGDEYDSGDLDGIGAQARFMFPGSLTIDAKGTLYVAQGCNVRMVTARGVVTTIAGSSTQCETHEGPLPALLPPVVGLTLANGGKELVLTGYEGVMRITGL